ncbi:MAG: hypothetical protein FWC91_11250 [Defluviitaleaceae bacterium]|nr:hypothetical protein [Defluviitaleaceae bacterium]
MDLQNFCWSWFEQSGHPSAYMEYLELDSKSVKKHPSHKHNPKSNINDHF